MNGAQNTPQPYQGRMAVLATKHRKEQVLGPPLQATVGLELFVPDQMDTDLFGTFSGEITRQGTPREVGLRKARLGMKISGLTLGLASEGSFGPHPQLLFVPVDHELLVFVDRERNIEVVEEILSLHTNYAQTDVKNVDSLKDFLARVQFPSHGLIVKPNSGLQPGLLFKGITDFAALQNAIDRCASASRDGLAHVETDMRAHMNPTRQQVLQEVAMKLGRRLATPCPACRTPGWGLVDVVKGLPCEWCGGATELVRAEIHGCPHCEYRESQPRSDGLSVASPGYCAECNP
jgi:hypothetical protein